MSDDFGDVEISDLPPHPRNSRDRLRPLFLKALQHHKMFPDLKEHQGWFKVYDRSDEFSKSIPKIHCVEGAISMEQIDNDVRDKEKKFKQKALEFKGEMSTFTVKRRGGAIYLKHTGRILKAQQFKDWEI